jgi:hypothetical protein
MPGVAVLGGAQDLLVAGEASVAAFTSVTVLLPLLAIQTRLFSSPIAEIPCLSRKHTIKSALANGGQELLSQDALEDNSIARNAERAANPSGC